MLRNTRGSNEILLFTHLLIKMFKSNPKILNKLTFIK